MSKTATYSLIQSQTLSSSQSTVTFSSIPQGFTDLTYIIYTNGTTGAPNSFIQLNGDSGGNYSATQLYATGSAGGASLRFANGTSTYAGTADGRSVLKGDFMDYSNTTTYKTVIVHGGTADGSYIDLNVGLWRSTAAITSITFSAGTSFAAGSTFKIYGIEAYK